MSIYLHDKEISAFETIESALAAIIQELNSEGLSTGWWSFQDTEVTIDIVNNFSKSMRAKGGAPYKYPIHTSNGVFTTKPSKELTMNKPYLYTGKLMCPTCGTTDLVTLFSDGPNPPELAGSCSVRWCKNGHVCVIENGYGQEVYNFKKES